MAAVAPIATKVFSPLSKVEYIVIVDADFNTACPALEFARVDGAPCECNSSKAYLNCGDDLEGARHTGRAINRLSHDHSCAAVGVR